MVVDNKYKDLLKLVTGTKKLLFMGFSFDDQFIRQLIKDHKDYFRGNHYILLDKPEPEKIKELKLEFGLITIEYDSSNSTHSEEIRKILATMAEQNKEENTSNRTEQSQSVVIGATITDLNKNVEGNLFYKKLKLENVDPFLIELSSAFYVAAEVYIRELKKNGMAVNVIDGVLRKVFTTYAERYYDTYKKNGDSQEFLEVVHDSLKNIDLGRLAMHFSEGEVLDEHENRGLIHILAEDEDQKVWWGDKRLK